MTADAGTDRTITAAQVGNALHLLTYRLGHTVELPEEPCEWPGLCDPHFCRFPRYSRAGEPTGLLGHLLIELGYPLEVLKALDTEYEMGEVLHPGVKVANSRNAALGRVDEHGMALLSYLQQHQKDGLSWTEIADKALARPRRVFTGSDKQRRPWAY